MAAPKLPPGFVTAQAVLDGKHSAGSKVNIVGIVTDFRAPLPPRYSNTDWKAEVQFYDKSIEDDTEAALSFHMFLPKEHIPDFGTGDFVVLIQVKVQQRSLQPFSLITNAHTDIHVFSASRIPRAPSDLSSALLPPAKKLRRQLTDAELKYISASYHSTDRSRVPAHEEYEIRKTQSTNVSNKFKELKDIQDGRFSDLVVRVVKKPYDLGEKITLWVSDYTENQLFFNHSFSLDGVSEIRRSDPYGYGARDLDTESSEAGWTGPFGKRSLQLTCYEPHASAIRSRNISEGSWVSVRNVQVKFGHNFANLEGFLREDREAPLKVNISPLDLNDEPDERLKAAIRRKKEYEKTKKQQLRSIVDAAEAGRKRKADMADREERPATNSKARRNQRRAKDRKSKQPEDESAFAAALNMQVKCENQNKPSSSVSDILKPVYCDTTIDGQSTRLPLPFVNLQYRLHVRVVDFYPPRLEEFTRPKVTSEYDVLSDDDESGFGSESGGESELPVASSEWEWRFFLKLEDVAAKDNQPDGSVWVVVDNFAAQCLLDLDASDLKNDRVKANDVRQRLFLLWGELEERKSQEMAKAPNNDQLAKRDRPPSDSDDEEAKKAPQGVIKVANLPFFCCVRQYGVKVAERNPRKADAGNSKRWERVFGLFGTRICMPEGNEPDCSL